LQDSIDYIILDFFENIFSIDANHLLKNFFGRTNFTVQRKPIKEIPPNVNISECLFKVSVSFVDNKQVDKLEHIG